MENLYHLVQNVVVLVALQARQDNLIQAKKFRSH